MSNYVVFVPDNLEFECVSTWLYYRKTKGHFFASELDSGSIKVITLDRRNTITFVHSGVGKLATAKSVFKVFRNVSNVEHIYDKVFLIGTTYGKCPGIYNVSKCYQEIDLRPVGRGMGESPDEPLWYESQIYNTNYDLPKATSLTMERFCTEFPDVTLYKDMSEPLLINMEDYAFCSMMDSVGIPYTILRGVTDTGNPSEWSKNVSTVMSTMLDMIFDYVDIVS